MPDLNTVPEVADDIHADLAAAFDAPPEDTGTVEPPPADTSVQPQDDRARDDQGRFAQKPADTAKLDTQPPAPVDPKAVLPGTQPPVDAGAALRPPPGWSIAAKAAFAALPKDVQEAVTRREQEVDQGFAKLAEYKGIDKAIEPFIPALTMRGVSPAQAIKQLFDAQAVLDRDPVNGIAWLARSYGVDLRQFAQGQQANGQQAGHQPNPLAQYLQPLVQEINALKGHFTTQQQQAVEHQRSQAVSEIQAFAADPKHTYFENLKDDMAVRIQSGMAKDLGEAYDQACWSHPDIRQRLISEQQQAAQGEAQRKAAEVAANARRAGGSITGAPVAGSSSLNTSPSGSIEDDLRAAFAEAGGRL